MVTGLSIIKPGVLTTLQDFGRFHKREIGLSTGGPMDDLAFLWANYLLNNHYNATALEITIGLAQFEATIDTQIAVTGADMGFSINRIQKANWHTYLVKAGDIISFNSSKVGLRAYLAIKGGFQTAKFFASSATVVREKLGGLNGGPLKSGDILRANSAHKNLPPRRVPTHFVPIYKRDIELSIIPGYQYDLFDNDAKQALTQNTYKISQRIDRMGCRLEGPIIPYHGENIISEGVALGSVQIPADGQPIILLNDSGTIGGYPKIGCIARTQLYRLAQCQPGYNINFSIGNVEEFSRTLLQRYHFFGVDFFQ